MIIINKTRSHYKKSISRFFIFFFFGQNKLWSRSSSRSWYYYTVFRIRCVCLIRSNYFGSFGIFFFWLLKLLRLSATMKLKKMQNPSIFLLYFVLVRKMIYIKTKKKTGKKLNWILKSPYLYDVCRGMEQHIFEIAFFFCFHSM